MASKKANRVNLLDERRGRLELGVLELDDEGFDDESGEDVDDDDDDDVVEREEEETRPLRRHLKRMNVNRSKVGPNEEPSVLGGSTGPG